MKDSKNITQAIKVVALSAVLAFGLQYVSAQTWQAPSGSPPNSNSPAPLNVGSVGQIKTGGATFGDGLSATAGTSDLGLYVKGGNVKFRLPGSAPAVGQVLQASDTAGTLAWGSGGVGSCVWLVSRQKDSAHDNNPWISAADVYGTGSSGKKATGICKCGGSSSSASTIMTSNSGSSNQRGGYLETDVDAGSLVWYCDRDDQENCEGASYFAYLAC